MNVEVSVLISVVTVLVSIVSVTFAIHHGLKKNKKEDMKDIEERVKGDTRINMKLDEIVSDVKDVKIDLSSLRDEIKLHNDRLIKVEESTKSAHHRLNMLEKRLNEKEGNNYD